MQINIESHMTLETGISERLGEILSKSYKKCLLIIDLGFYDTEIGKRITKKLSEHLNVTIIQTRSSNEPTYDDIGKYLKTEEFNQFKNDHNSQNSVVLGVGGGSAMDIAKVISALVTNVGSPLDYRGFDQLQYPGVDCYLVPTTAGTGSESSYNASLIDTSSNRKMGINGRYMYAKGSFIDPEIMLACPREVALSSAVDAFVHCAEGFICKNSNPISDGLATKGLELIWSGLKVFEGEWQNTKNWKKLMLGAHIGGIVQMNSGSGIAAAISYPLGVYHSLPHGICGGIFAPGIMEFNQQNGISKYESLNYISAGNFVDKTISRFAEIGVPTNLSKYGIFLHDLDHIVGIMATQQAAFDQNPIHFSVDKDFAEFMTKYLEK